MCVLAVWRMYSITVSSPTTNPPRLEKLFENVPVVRSTRSSSPNTEAEPRPPSPTTPTAWASSRSRAAPNSSASSTSPGTLASVPDIENTPSVTMSLPASGRSSLVRWRNVRRWSRSLCR